MSRPAYEQKRQRTDERTLQGITYTISANANVIGIKKCRAGILLVSKTSWLSGKEKDKFSSNFAKKGKDSEKEDAQEWHVGEEDGDD